MTTYVSNTKWKLTNQDTILQILLYMAWNTTQGNESQKGEERIQEGSMFWKNLEQCKLTKVRQVAMTADRAKFKSNKTLNLLKK